VTSFTRDKIRTKAWMTRVIICRETGISRKTGLPLNGISRKTRNRKFRPQNFHFENTPFQNGVLFFFLQILAFNFSVSPNLSRPSSWRLFPKACLFRHCIWRCTEVNPVKPAALLILPEWNLSAYWCL
jgi:hypothetical protein